MSFWLYVLRTARFHWRGNCAVALGAAAATAVLTGALIVGDSVRGSLRSLTLERLGKIDQVLVAENFFRPELAAELETAPGFANHFSAVVPGVVLSQGTLECARAGQRTRATGVVVVGAEGDYWKLDAVAPPPAALPGENEVVLNEPLAAELGAGVGDAVTLRLPGGSQAPAESPLGEKADRTRSLVDLKVVAVVPARGLGRFSLAASQETSRNAFLAPATLQRALELEQPNLVNALLVAGRQETESAASTQAAELWLRENFLPQPGDYGIRVTRVRREFQPAAGEPQVAFEYLSVSTDRLLLDDRTARSLEQALGGDRVQPVLTYLANTLAKVPENDSRSAAAPANGATNSERAPSETPTGIPYSTVAAFDFVPGLPELRDVSGNPLSPLADDEIVLTSWAAADLAASPGDTVELVYFEPETTHGTARETAARFRVAAITPLVEPHEPYTRKRPALFRTSPAAANDPDLTPTVPGITDAESLSRWKAPFPFDYARIRSQDDTYWENHRTTPKAFISRAAGQRLWASRFGSVTSLRVPLAKPEARAWAEREIAAQLARDHLPLGSGFLPVKRQGLAASQGATPFDVLFLALSTFIVVSALLLVVLLFRLSFERRAAEAGLLLALGIPQRQLARLLVAEGLWIALAGAGAGIPLGMGYAALLIAGLNSWWQGAVATNFLALHITGKSLAVGGLAGMAMALATLAWCARATRGASARRLLAGQTSAQAAWLSRPPSWPWRVAGLLVVVSLGLSLAASRLSGEAQAGAFVAAGMGLLVALLLALWVRLQQNKGEALLAGSYPLWQMARRTAGRNPARSVTTIALVAAAAFLIVSMGAFRQVPTAEGLGGCELLAEGDRPLFGNLNDPLTRRDLLRSQADALTDTTILSLRLHAGDDASCRNLYQAARPRILGVPPEFIAHYNQPQATAFAWAGSAATTDAARANPWQVLAASEGFEPIPVVLDKNTALYSLHLYGGIGQEFTVPRASGGSLRFRVAGLLSNSVLQGSLLMNERDFLSLFPQEPGYRWFLISTPASSSGEVARILETELGDYGWNVVSARERLAALLAVQNTYLSTFQTLGALGLLLGTFGLAAVLARSVFERRAELALLQALGIERARLLRLVLLEHTWLLLSGLGAGTLAALAAVLPHALLGSAAGNLVYQFVPLAAVLLLGWGVGYAVVRGALAAPLVPALRGE